MISGKTILAIIPARGGSKGVPRKNIRQIAGKPLLYWTIKEAKRSRYIDRLILSSEDNEIINVARECGCEAPFIRPHVLAEDNTSSIEVVLHAIDTLKEKYDYVVLLQPTSPLRKAQDIEGCIELCVKKNAPACLSITETGKSPYWMYTLDKKSRLRPLIQSETTIKRRQELPKVYALNGAVYMANTEWLMQNRTFVTEKTTAFKMPNKRSWDIDTETDFKICEMYLLSNE